jgi:glycosyltransferase involved in cell wall biosynthesis
MHEPIYDLTLVIEGCARLFETHAGAHVVFAGDGSLRGELEQRAAARLPAGRYRFVGRVGTTELAAWLARAEVYVSASHSDSTSQSLLEAMAAGAVPVVSDIAGNREWVRDGDSARLFPVGDAGSLARELAHVLDDPAWAEAARARAAAIIAERGDWHTNLARIERLLLAVAAGRGGAEAGA